MNQATPLEQAMVAMASEYEDVFRERAEVNLVQVLARLRGIDLALNHPETHFESRRELQREKNRILHGQDHTPQPE